MSPPSDKLRTTLVDQLDSFESKLDDKVDDIAMLADIQEGIGRLLGDNATAEADIRRVLQERYEGGNLRKETFQLVKSMLDRYVTEQAPTSPGTPTTQSSSSTPTSPGPSSRRVLWRNRWSLRISPIRGKWSVRKKAPFWYPRTIRLRWRTRCNACMPIRRYGNRWLPPVMRAP